SNKGALGLVVNWNPQGRLVVTQIVPGGPAANAGVSVGDRLFSIDGKNIDGLPAAQVFASIVGSVGTTAVLSLESPTKGRYEARITRVPVDALNKSSNFNVGWQVNSPNQQSGQSNDSISGQNNTVNNNSVSTINNTNSYSYQSGGVNWNVSGGGEAGYSLKYPNGWTVEQNAKTGRIEVKSPDASRLS
ncbi:MAG: PDZ domain-containing protein, partial [Cyanobacteria bacterium HKST-UBA01]|nr:PDZ domain-containing protein [Cyanobacteria bacterium HKST-UBA01]